MDSKTINIFSRKSLGFFLTIGPDNKENAKEHHMYNKAIDLIAKELREQKIRAYNVHDNWAKIYKMASQVEDLIMDYNFPDFDEAGSALSYSYALIMSVLGQYNYIFERRKAEESKEGSKKVEVEEKPSAKAEPRKGKEAKAD